ncbi:MAG: hypothetical protein ABL998_06795 [Planctomycetota bacterium]
MGATKTITLKRRGQRHGTFASARPAGLPERSDALARWRADRPLQLAGILAAHLPRLRAPIARTLRVFDALRADERSFESEVRARLKHERSFSPSGSVVDTGDEREIEKVYVDGMRGKTFAARGLYAKLSWIAHDPRDVSLRIRFSFGSERLFDWQKETRRAPWAARYAEAVFPECRAMSGNTKLVAALERLAARRVRLSERIIYNNAPEGGAIFHHDCEPWQLGVVFGQLAGATAWLALPKRELAGLVAEFTRGTKLARIAGTPAKALKALDREGDETMETLLNRTPRFTRLLAERGHLLHLVAGDALLLPNHGWNDTCWHSVFALGDEASLAHSYGIFARRRGREA